MCWSTNWVLMHVVCPSVWKLHCRTSLFPQLPSMHLSIACHCHDRCSWCPLTCLCLCNLMCSLVDLAFCDDELSFFLWSIHASLLFIPHLHCILNVIRIRVCARRPILDTLRYLDDPPIWWSIRENSCVTSTDRVKYEPWSETFHVPSRTRSTITTFWSLRRSSSSCYWMIRVCGL